MKRTFQQFVASEGPPPSENGKKETEKEKEEEEEEEDYMSMALLTEPNTSNKPPKETTFQRQRRLRLEAEARGRVKSKAERLEEEKAARDLALKTSLIKSADEVEGQGNRKEKGGNKALAMMRKMGFKPGMALGKEGTEGGRIEPIGVKVKGDKAGVGMEEEKRRKWQEVHEAEVGREKAGEEEYRERVRREREDARLERLIGAAMRVVEKMDEEESREAGESGGGSGVEALRPLKSINVLYRGLIRRREEKEREKRMHKDMLQSLSTRNDEGDVDYDVAYGDDAKQPENKKEEIVSAITEQELEEEDPELEEFDALEPAMRMEKLVDYLRTMYRYCFWCKFQYGDEAMEGCPGDKEEDHD